MKNSSLKILLSPLFLLGLFLLLLNDFFLKDYFHNFFTGKLSDFAGLFIFPIFFCAFFPHRKNLIFLLTGLFFIFWKSPFSQNLIDGWNSFSYIKVDRVVDVTDLSALSILLLSYFYFAVRHQKPVPLGFTKRLMTSFVIIISVFAFTATSSINDQHLLLENKYEFKSTKSEIENVLRQNEKISYLKVERGTEKYPPTQYPHMKANPNEFYVSFLLKEEICTTYANVSFHIQENKFTEVNEPTEPVIARPPESASVKSTIISRVSFDFRCEDISKQTSNIDQNLKQNSNIVTKMLISEATSIFEREIIRKLNEKDLLSAK